MLALIGISLATASLFSNGSDYNQIIQTQQFNNQAIEQDETASFELSSYFTGSQLDYWLSIVNLNKTIDFNSGAYSQMMKIVTPNRNITSIPIMEVKSEISIDPFPRSTILYQEQGGLKMSLFILRRNFTFSRYEVSKYADGDIHFLFSVQLDKSIVNDSCSDMNVVEKRAIIMFCRSIILDRSSLVTSYIYSTVQIDDVLSEDTDAIPTVRYITYTSSGPAYQDYRSGLKYIGEDRNSSDNVGLLYIGNRLITLIDNLPLQQVIFRLNYQTFITMRQNNETNRLLSTNPLSAKLQIAYDLPNIPYDVLDYGLYDHKTGMIGILFNHYGLLFCQFGPGIFDVVQYIFWSPVLSCNSSNSQLFLQDTAISLYQNPLETQYVYIAQAYPPGVTEIDVSNPYNAFIYNKYQTNIQTPFDYVGMATIATNRNYIIHLMLKVDTQEQVLRVYNRNSTRFNSILTDLILPPYSRTTFFAFPNMYINIMIFRDERRINVTAFYNYSLELSGINATLFDLFVQDVFNVTLTAENAFSSTNTSFFVTYIDNNSTSIQTSSNNQDLSIFYNCGDNTFQYQISYLFNGPNFNVSYDKDDPDCDTGQCYFDIINQDFDKQFESLFNFSQCKLSYIFGDNEIDENKDEMIMICVNQNKSMVSSYTIIKEIQTIVLTAEIQIPMVEFKFFEADLDNRAMFTLSEVINQDWVVYNKEIHFFHISDRILWKNYTYNFTDNYFAKLQYTLDDIKEFTYNQIINKGIIVANLGLSSEMMIYYSMEFAPTIYSELGYVSYNVTPETSTKRAKVSSLNFIYTLQADNTLRLYQVVQESLDSNISLIIPLRIIFTSAIKIVYDFDIFDGKYFVLYLDEQKIEIYEIMNEITLQYKMKLPLYRDYVDFKFDFLLASGIGGIYPESGIVRSYYNGFLSIYLTNDNFRGQRSGYVFVYALEQNQHNSYVMDINVTSLFLSSSNKQILMTGNTNKDQITFIADQKMQIFNIEYFNFLILKNDITLLSKLIANCSQNKVGVNQQGYDQATQIGEITLIGESAFAYEANQTDISSPITIKIYSDNQGLAITPSNKNGQFQITYAKEDSATTSFMIMDEFIEGFNLTFNAACSYYDSNGQICDCTSNQSVKDTTSNMPYNFFIEFVTNQRQVAQSFTLGKLFFMLDTLHNLNVQMLFNDMSDSDANLDLDSIKGYPLTQIYQIAQVASLGCNVTNFLGFIHVEYNSTADPPFNLYLVTYQCYINMTLNFKIATFTIFDYATDDKTYFLIQQFNNSLRIPYQILDLDKGTIQINQNNTNLLSAKIILICEIPGSYSNNIYVYNLTVDMGKNIMSFDFIRMENSLTLSKNTFKINSISPIPDTNLFLLVDITYGVYIYDLDLLVMIGEYDLKQDSSFNSQQQEIFGPLTVYSVYGDWPYNIQIITNFGIFIYSFSINLLDKLAVYSDFLSHLKPVRQRLIRSFFDNFNHEIVGNHFGYTFLIKKILDEDTFDMYLGVVSFYSNQNSMILKMQKVSENEECIALNYEHHLTDPTQEDLIAVSFICNTQLFIVMINLNPSYEIDLSSYTNATKTLKSLDDKNQYVEDAIEYTEFNMTIQATNQYTIGDVNNVSINVNFHYKNNQDTSQPIFYVVGIFLLLLTALLIFFLNHGTELREQQDTGLFNEYSLAPKLSIYTKQRNINLQDYSKKSPHSSKKLKGKKKVRISEHVLDTQESLGVSQFKMQRSLTKRRVTNKSDSLKLQKEGSPRQQQHKST